jgi:hypothetical protein
MQGWSWLACQQYVTVASTTYYDRIYCASGLLLADLVVGDSTPASEMLKPGELPGDSVIPIINITYRVGRQRFIHNHHCMRIRT